MLIINIIYFIGVILIMITSMLLLGWILKKTIFKKLLECEDKNIERKD